VHNTLEKKASKRRCIVNELIKTEEDYLNDLNVIVDDIMKPLSERQVCFIAVGVNPPLCDKYVVIFSYIYANTTKFVLNLSYLVRFD